MWWVVLAGLVFMAGCGGDDMGSRPEPVAARDYALLESSEWELQEALDPPADDPFTSIGRPPMDWYAEYLHWPTANESQMVVLSGHSTDFDESREQLATLALDLQEVDVEGWRAAGVDAGEDAGPALVLLEYGDGSLTLLSHETDLEALVDLASRVQPADTATWVAAGGLIH